MGIVVLQEYGRKWFVIREMHYWGAGGCTVLGGFFWGGALCFGGGGWGAKLAGLRQLLRGRGLFREGGVDLKGGGVAAVFGVREGCVTGGVRSGGEGG